MATELDSAQKAELARIQQRIKVLIENQFAKGKPSYFLSQLGNELGDEDRKLLESLTGKKISQFVADTFNYAIGRSGQHDNILYLIAPEGAPAPAGPAPRYNNRFWAAFKVPTADGERRFIDIETFEFAPDAIELSAPEERVREIDSQYLPKVGDAPTTDEILTYINQWLSAQKLDQGPFLAQRRKHNWKQETILTSMINALDKDQLKRVILPLDVIQTLNSPRG